MTQVQGAWTAALNGGHVCASNPQFALSLPHACNVTLLVEREKAAPGAPALPPHVVRLVRPRRGDDWHAADGHAVMHWTAADMVMQSVFSRLPNVKVESKEPVPAGEYIVMCAQYLVDVAAAPGDFTLTATAMHPTQPRPTLVPLLPARTMSHSLRFAGEGAAGCESHRNPQFFVTTASPMRLGFRLAVDDPIDDRPGQTSHIVVMRSDQGPGQRLRWWGDHASRLVATQNGMKYLASGATLGAVPAGTYAVLVWTKTPVEGKVTLLVDMAPPGKGGKPPTAQLTGAEYVKPEYDARPFSEIVEHGVKELPFLGFGMRPLFYDVVDGKRIVDAVTAACAKANNPTDAGKSKGAATVCFADGAFPATHASLYGPSALPVLSDRALEAQVGFLRQCDVHPEPELFSDGADVLDLVQGSLGDCYLCAAIAAVASIPKHFEDRIYPPTYNPAGIYMLQVCVAGKWRGVLLDDTLAIWPEAAPMPNDRRGDVRLFAHSADRRELWPCLVEKALAKMAGCYAELEGMRVVRKGTMSAPLIVGVLAGATDVSMFFSDDMDWWDKVKLLVGDAADGPHVSVGKIVDVTHRPRAMCGIGTGSNKRRPETWRGLQDGVVGNHAYTLIRAVTLNDDGTHCVERGAVVARHRLVQIRNTWGRQEWSGDWADGDAKWRQHPAVAAAVGIDPDAKQNDGVFWMPMEAVKRKFSFTWGVTLSSEELEYDTSVDGEWVDGNNVLLPNPQGSVGGLPQFALRCRCPGARLSITLSSVGEAAPRSLSLALFPVKGARPPDATMWAPELSRFMDAPIQTLNIIGDKRSLTKEVTLEDDVSAVIVVALAWRLEPLPRLPFVLSVASNADVKIEGPLHPAERVALEGKWPAPGDRYRGPASSLRFYISSRTAASDYNGDSELQLSLRLTDAGKGATNALQLYVFHLSGDDKELAAGNGFPADDDSRFLAKSSFSATDAVSVRCLVKAGCSLVAVATRQKSCVEGDGWAFKALAGGHVAVTTTKR
jgi:hypothetical protein